MKTVTGVVNGFRSIYLCIKGVKCELYALNKFSPWGKGKEWNCLKGYRTLYFQGKHCIHSPSTTDIHRFTLYTNYVLNPEPLILNTSILVIKLLVSLNEQRAATTTTFNKTSTLAEEEGDKITFPLSFIQERVGT